MATKKLIDQFAATPALPKKTHLLECAASRLKTALSYGPDMRSSRDHCVADAASLIGDALDCEMPQSMFIHASAARAALMQNAHFDSDIRFALYNLEDALGLLKQ